MTRDQLKQLFPNASESFIRNNSAPVESSKPERSICHESLAEKKAKRDSPTRFHIRVKSFRKRLCDPDNLTVKWGIDSLRYAGIIPDDTAKDISLEISQEKSEDERTEITITQLYD